MNILGIAKEMEEKGRQETADRGTMRFVDPRDGNYVYILDPSVIVDVDSGENTSITAVVGEDRVKFEVAETKEEVEILRQMVSVASTKLDAEAIFTVDRGLSEMTTTTRKLVDRDVANLQERLDYASAGILLLHDAVSGMRVTATDARDVKLILPKDGGSEVYFQSRSTDRVLRVSEIPSHVYEAVDLAKVAQASTSQVPE